MIREAAQNTIGHLKDLLNENNKIVERYKRKLIESQKDIGQENYRDCIRKMREPRAQNTCHQREKHFVTSWIFRTG